MVNEFVKLWKESPPTAFFITESIITCAIAFVSFMLGFWIVTWWSLVVFMFEGGCWVMTLIACVDMPNEHLYRNFFAIFIIINIVLLLIMWRGGLLGI